jgi:hypothetical protein
MANSKSSTGRTFARHVAPFAPLALSLLMSGVPQGSSKPATEEMSSAGGGVVAERCDDVTDFQDCHSRFPTGCSAAAGYDAYLNLLKNDLIAPPPPSTAITFLSQNDYAALDAGIPSGLTSHNHASFKDQLSKMGEGETRGVIGFLYYFQPTSAESSNCDLTGPSDDPDKSNVDYHIGIGFDPTAAQNLRSSQASTVGMTASSKKRPKSPSSGKGASELQQTSVIVEMTPHYRFQFEHEIWNVSNLGKAVGRQVRVVGQLLIDSEHNMPSQNCATAKTSAQRQSCWRASVWELHPVERFQVCAKDTNDCSSDDAANWVELDQL